MEETDQPAVAPETNVAEKPKKCKHIPIIVILVLLFAGSLAFGIVELALNLQKKPDNCKTDDEPVSINNNGDEDKPINNDKPSNNTGDTPTANTHTGSVRIEIAIDFDSVETEACKSDCDGKGQTGYFDVALEGGLYGRISDGTIVAYENMDGDFSGVVFNKKIEKKFKVNGKLKQAMFAHLGNGGEEVILLLREDGTVAAVHLDSNPGNYDIILTNNLKGLSGIVVLRRGVSNDGDEVYAIDKNGNAKSIYEALH